MRIAPLGQQRLKWIALGAFLSLFIILNGVLFYKTRSMSKSVLAMTFVLALFVIAMVCLYCFWRKKNEETARARVFLISLFVLGLSFMAVLTPGTVPDEPYHYYASYLYSNAMLGVESDAGTIAMRVDDQDLMNTTLQGKNYADVLDGLRLKASDTTISNVDGINVPSLSDNPVQIKLLSALGITLGRLLGLSGYITFYLGRLCNLAMYIALVFLAYRLTPIAKPLFAAVSLLPMTLSLASSYSYDAGVISLGLLLTALCLKALFEGDKLSIKLMISIAAVTALIAPCKIIYTAIVLMIFLVPNKRFSSSKWAYMYKFGLLVMAGAVVLVSRFAVVTEVAASASGEVAVSTSIGSALHTYSEFYTAPLQTALTFVRSLFDWGDFYFESMLGGSMGWYQVELLAPDFIPVTFLILLLLMALPTEKDSRPIKIAVRISMAAITMLVVFLVMTSMFVGWTSADDSVIQGVQGRYFLPILILALCALRGNWIQRSYSSDTPLTMCMLASNSAYLLFLFSTVLANYII